MSWPEHLVPLPERQRTIGRKMHRQQPNCSPTRLVRTQALASAADRQRGSTAILSFLGIRFVSLPSHVEGQLI
jgi:hypothetical protein